MAPDFSNKSSFFFRFPVNHSVGSLTVYHFFFFATFLQSGIYVYIYIRSTGNKKAKQV